MSVKKTGRSVIWMRWMDPSGRNGWSQSQRCSYPFHRIRRINSAFLSFYYYYFILFFFLFRIIFSFFVGSPLGGFESAPSIDFHANYFPIHPELIVASLKIQRGWNEFRNFTLPLPLSLSRADVFFFPRFCWCCCSCCRYFLLWKIYSDSSEIFSVVAAVTDLSLWYPHDRNIPPPPSFNSIPFLSAVTSNDDISNNDRRFFSS